MKPTRVAVSVLVALAVVVATACGSSKQSVPSDAVAVVDGTSITKKDLSALLNRAKITYETQKRAFPKAGTAEYQALQTQAVAYLVQRAEYEQKAAEFKLSVTEKEVTDRLEQVKKQTFGGSQAKLDKQLKAQGYTTESARALIKSNILSEKIYNEVTKNAKVSDADISKYYQQNKAQYVVPESRDVRHILVAVQKNGKPAPPGTGAKLDYPRSKALAEQIRGQLSAGADFAALAKKYSQDSGSSANGGKLTAVRGRTVPPFDAAAFSLQTKAISQPIKTQFGYHVIQPISAVKPPTTTSLKTATPEIQAQLLDKAKNDAITKWTGETTKFFAKKVSYATGYAPPAAATNPATSTG